LSLSVIPLFEWIHQQERKRRDAADRIGSFQAPFDIVRELHYKKKKKKEEERRSIIENMAGMKARQTFQYIYRRIEYSFSFKRYITIYIHTV
jgi:hypothetical protein